MSIQFTILGLGQIGASIGLGLASQKENVTRVGHDKALNILKAAQKMGALDKTDYNLPSSVENADVILLCIPANEIQDTLKYIAPVLKENAVIIDFSPIKSAAIGWAKEHLPANRYYIGLTAGINPEYLHLSAEGVDSARADLFQHGTMFINAPQGTPESVVKLANDLSNLLGANALFVDTEEVDSLMTGIHILPQLAAASLLELTVDQPGWREARMVASHVFAQNASALVDENGLSASAMLNKKNTLRMLDAFIESLQTMRTEIEAENTDALKKKFVKARESFTNWKDERYKNEWQNNSMPKQENISLAKLAQHFFVGGLFKKRDEQ